MNVLIEVHAQIDGDDAEFEDRLGRLLGSVVDACVDNGLVGLDDRDGAVGSIVLAKPTPDGDMEPEEWLTHITKDAVMMVLPVQKGGPDGA